MKRVLFFTVLVFFAVAHLQADGFAKLGSLEYMVSMPHPHTHYFEVEILLQNHGEGSVDFKLPVWTPGSYLVREFAKNVEGFTASYQADGKPISYRKVNKNTWRIDAKKDKSIRVSYRVYSFEGYIRMSYLDEDHALIMANTILMYVQELKDNSSVLRLSYPDSWKNISTSLTNLNGAKDTYYIPNYDILVDSPIEIGNHEIINFEAAGIPHEVAMVGKVEFDKDQLVRDLTKIVESATAIFDENPNEKYTFIIQTDRRGGGLEHMSSTVLGVSRWTFSNQRSYNYFLSLAAHEYFHLWMVKRIKPVELEKFDYDNEVYTDLLWVMEGFTSYFEEKIMLDCGFYSEQKFIDNILSGMAKIKNTPGAKEQSVVDASFDAWIKHYRQNENSINNQISYYGKGMVLGALLDLKIISATEGEKRLDDVVNELYYQYYKKKNKGITSEDLKHVAENIGGMDLADFFGDYIIGIEDLDNEKYLKLAGITLVETNGAVSSKTLGISISQKENGMIINSVIKGSSAFDNGLNVSDELVAINGYRLSAKNLELIINQYDEGEKVSVLLARKGLMIEKEVDIRKDTSVSYTYELVKSPTKQQQKVYNTWLGK